MNPATRLWPAFDLLPKQSASLPGDFSDRLAVALDDLDVIAIEDDEREPRWRVYFGDAAARDAAGPSLNDAFGAWIDIRSIDVEDEGWALKVQQDLRAVRVDRIVVAPPWDLPATGGAAIDASDALNADASSRPLTIVIEPSMGFGTGHHQSTRLCLRALQSLPLGGRRLLDVGTGSGVLAFAAARLGAASVRAIDNDPDSIAAARDNSTRNGLDGCVSVELLDLGDASLQRCADVVVANLTAWLLTRARDAMLGLVAPGGRFVLSGFTTEQVPLVTHAFASCAVERQLEEEEWIALILKAPGSEVPPSGRGSSLPRPEARER